MRIAKLLAACAMILGSQSAWAASGEMGTGIPTFGVFGSPASSYAYVWSIGSPTIAFPAGCTGLYLKPETLGIDAYKIALATLTTAKVSGMRVRFYAHVERDGGCGVDYFGLVD